MKYLYYKLWQDFTGIVKDNSPPFGAMIWLSVVQGVNIGAILVLIKHYFNIEYTLDSKNEVLLFATLVCLILYIINYFLLYKKREEIAEKYKSESKFKSRIGLILLYLYMIGSFFLIYFVSTRFSIQ